MADIVLGSITDPSPELALGNRVTEFEGFDRIEAPPTVTHVALISEELIAHCPITGQPDFYQIDVSFTPGRWILETKTFKLYLASYRNVGIFAETLADKIATEIGEELGAKDCVVHLTQKSRGGVTTKVIARWSPK